MPAVLPGTAVNAQELHDDYQIRNLEYWCKLSFRSVDLHVRSAWSLCGEKDVEKLRSRAQQLEGPTVYSLLDLEDLLGDDAVNEGWRHVLEAGNLGVDWRDVEFPIGSLELPRSLRRGQAKAFLVCRVALGRASSAKEDGVPRYPEFFSSCQVRNQPSLLAARARGAEHTDPVADWQQVYRVKSGEQVLPFAICEVVFEERRNMTKPLICDYCEQRPATVYCKNDNAHFCTSCDQTHHSENEFFARHQRFPLEHSPLQFGFCRHHPSERVESVCMDCKELLCRLCNKIGDHARKEHEGHVLVSTVEAFQVAMQGSSDSDVALDKHNSLLREVMQERHFQLLEVQANFEETQNQMDVVLRNALEQLDRAQSRKVEFLQSMKRQVTSQLLFIQWLDSFQAHARLALPPADFVVATKRHEALLAALFGNSADSGKVLKGAEIGVGTVPPWVDEELLLEGAVAVQLATIPPPITVPGPEIQETSLRALGAFGEAGPLVPSQRSIAGAQDPGVTYLEATPRARSSPAAKVAAARPPAGIGGHSDILYAQPIGASAASAAPWEEGRSRELQAAERRVAGAIGASASRAVDQVPGKISESRAEFDGYVSQAFAYLDEAQKRTEAWPALPAVASAAVPARIASLQLATEVLVQLRQSAESIGGPGKSWGTLLCLLTSCPGGERHELLLRALKVAAPIGDTAGQLAKSVVDDDVQRTQVPSLLISANGLSTALVQALQRLDDSTFMEKELLVLVKEVEVLPATTGTPPGAASNAMHSAVEAFISSMVHSLRSGQGNASPSLVSVCHLVYSSAEVKFGVVAAQNAVVTLLVSRVITPSLLRVAQRPSDISGARGGTLSERVSELSRLLQRVAHFAHHDDEAARSPASSVPDLNQVFRHVASLRELVSRVLSLPSDPSLGLSASTQDAEAAALWVVSTCQRWAGGVPSDISFAGDPPGRPRHQQLLSLAAKPLARLREPSLAAEALPDPASPAGLP
eukprot:TRINITY_DN27167_c0_g1_i1.p1 TRINITY_DN27167_c0_g1~~TRINITY_DN27167_c0_g1_i1.p1  ORF type:complete len:985 (-),score=203.37 TRINITY_DN27167_c0_g1_i1:38-2992(-)